MHDDNTPVPLDGSPARPPTAAGRAAFPGAGLRITVLHPAGAVLVRLAGEIDMDQEAALRDALDRAVQQRPPRLVIDMSDVTFSDSTGVNVLLGAHRAAVAADVELLIVGLRTQPRRLLALTGADEILATHPDISSALADLRQE